MKFRKLLGTLPKYGFFIIMLVILVISLYKDAISITDKMELIVRILTDSLMISAIVCAIGSFIVVDHFFTLLTGKLPNFVDDIREDDSRDFSVKYNGIAGTFFVGLFFIALCMLYVYTQNRIFEILLIALSVIYTICIVIDILAQYFKIKKTQPTSFLSKYSGPIFLPIIICVLQVLVTKTDIVKFVCHNICNPQNDAYFILLLIAVLCCFLAIAFCHFSNIYCLIGFAFVKKDVEKIKNAVERMEAKDEELDEALRKTTDYVDKTAENSGFFKRIGLFFLFSFTHTKIYIQNKIYAVIYLLSFINLRITTWFRGLLEPERIRINGIRFCCVFAVLELLVLDMVLFIFLDADAPGLKFFELFSTVIIIPILLSWLSDLKSKKDE